MRITIKIYLLLTVLLGSCIQDQPISVLYSVKSGDYLGKIASELNVKTIDIKEWNKLESDNIKIGQKLIIYYPSDRTDSLKFGMTANEVELSIGIPPREVFINQDNGVKYLIYNVDSKNMGLLNNSSIKGLKGLQQFDIETVSFGFIENSLSTISYDYRGLGFKEYYSYLTTRGFSFKERAPLYWNGKGSLYGEEVFVDLANMIESGYIYCTFFRKTEKVFEIFNIKDEK